MRFDFGNVPVVPAWWCLGIFLILSSTALRIAAPSFAYEVALDEMPIAAFVALYVAVAGVAYAVLPRLIRETAGQAVRHVLILVLIVGAAARLMQLGTPAVLEDDYNRYLWDGAVLAIAESPFAHSPLDVANGQAGSADLRALAERSGHVLERVNYPEYRTIYPPAAQAAFAVSHVVAPFDLDGWRIVLFLFELGCLALIYVMLVMLGRSELWLALYWWNPLVIKEIANSGHMEPVLMMPVLAAGFLVLKGRRIRASAFLAIAAGVKIWPLLLTTAVWRQDLDQRRILLAAISLTGLLLAALFWPVIAARLDASSGFVAFAQNWKASSAAFLVSEWLVGRVAPAHENAALMIRATLALIILTIVAVICLRRAADSTAVFTRLFLIVATLYLLSPSHTPWYFVWIAPFLCFFPVRGLQLAGVTLPLHYLYFHLAQQDQEMLYRHGVVWAIWLPVWALLLFDTIRAGVGSASAGEVP